MARASTPTKLPLATWARIVGIHPLHFEQIAFTPQGRAPMICDAAWLQYDWQAADKVSRETVARAVAQAEEMIEQHLGYRLIPSWETDEWRHAARPFRPEDIGYVSSDIRQRASAIQPRWSYIQSGGIESKTLISAGEAIVWSNTYAGDEEDPNAPANDLATVSVTVPAGTVECEVEAYYPGHSGEAEWQIRPISVDISGTSGTITFGRELAVAEALLTSYSPVPADWEDDADFLSEVDVYRHRNDPSQQATLLWAPLVGCGVCGGAGCVSCAYATQTACLHLRGTRREATLGWSPGSWDADEEEFTTEELVLGYAPDLIRLYYYAGNVAPTGCPRVMERKWADAVAYLALTLLERPTCNCNQDIWQYWREDLAVLSGGEQDRTYGTDLRQAAATNPFGSRRGALYAWNRVNEPAVAVLPSGSLP